MYAPFSYCFLKCNSAVNTRLVPSNYSLHTPETRLVYLYFIRHDLSVGKPNAMGNGWIHSLAPLLSVTMALEIHHTSETVIVPVVYLIRTGDTSFRIDGEQ